MAKYLLGERSAAWLRAAMARKAPPSASGDTRYVRFSKGESDDFPHPFTLQYAASAGEPDGETGAPPGAWVIWVPDGALVIDGETVDVAGALTAAQGYPDGWYDLTDVFNGDDPDDDFKIYLDASAADPKFVLDPEDATTPVLIAIVSGKTVKGVVESALVIGGGNKKPFDIVSDVEEIDDEEQAVKKIVRCVWMAGGNVVTCNDFTIPSLGETGLSIFAVITITPGQTAAAASTYSFGVQAVDLGDVPEASAESGHENDVVFYAPLYDIDANGSILADYRDALVTLDWIGADEISCSYGGDGDSPSYMHLKDFYNSNSDASSLPQSGAVVARVSSGNSYSLKYIPLSLIGGGGGGGGGSGHGGTNDDVAVGGSGGIFAWTAATRTIGAGGCMVGRRWYSASGTGSGKADGLYQLKVTLTSSGATAKVVSGVSLGTSPNGNVSYIPIYQIASGKISVDYRGAFVVPAYE